MAANSHNELPLVSILIPCYNQADFLAEAIDSALNQTYPRIEVIVINDGSTDHTVQVAGRYGTRICYIHKTNAGLSAARNTAILCARGEFVHFLDADDYLPPDMLQHQLTTALSRPEAGVFHSSWQEIDTAGCPGIRHTVRSLARDTFHTLLANNLGPPCCVTARRAVFANAGLFDVSLVSCEDWDMWLRLAATGVTFVAVPQACAFYRRHAGSMSMNFETMWRMARVVLRKAMTCHPVCAACRKIMSSSLRSHRNTYFSSLVLKDVLKFWKQSQYGTGTLHLMRAFLRHPALAGFLYAVIIMRLRRLAQGFANGKRVSLLPKQ